MNGYRPMGNESHQVYENYSEQISRYQTLLSKELESDESSATSVAYYQDEIARYQKLQRKAQQKELLRTKTHQKVTELKEEIKSFTDSQKVMSKEVASSFSKSAKANYKGVIEGEATENFQLTLADIALKTEEIDISIDQF